VTLQSFSGGRYVVARFGARPPAVLGLPGWQRTTADFRSVFSGLDAVAVDLPGFGLSPPPETAWGSPEYAEWLVPLVAELAERAGHPVVLVGHSFGGRVGVRLAARHPDLVAAAVLVGAPLARLGPPPRPRLRLRVARRLAAAGLVSPGWVDRLRERYGSQDYRQAVGVMREVLVRTVGEEYGDDLRRLACPVLVVVGENDPVVTPAVAQAVAAQCPAARVVVLPGVGHLVPTEAPDALAREVRRVLAAAR